MAEREGQILRAGACKEGDVIMVLSRRHKINPYQAKINEIQYNFNQSENEVVRLAVSPWTASQQQHVPRAIGGGTKVLVVKETKRTKLPLRSVKLK